MRSPAWIPIASLVLTQSAVAQVQHQNHPPRSAQEYARVLEDPSRDAWQKPHDVITALSLRPDEVVADIGAGSGYFSRRFVRHAGQVIAVDIDKDLLALAAKDAPPNHKTLLSAPDDPRLPAASVDTVFICDVLHHIENRPAYLRKLVAALKPGGRIVVVDFYKKPLPVGPGVAMKLSEEEVSSDMGKAGLKLMKSLNILPHQYFLFFERK